MTEKVGKSQGEPQHPLIPEKKNKAAAEMGRKGGKKGGAARAARTSPQERAASARLDAQSRWAKKQAHRKAELDAGSDASGAA